MIEGAAEVEKGQAKEISGLRKIDDTTLEMTLTEKVRPGLLLLPRAGLDLSGRRGPEGELCTKPIGLGPFKFVEHVPGSRVVPERCDQFYKPGKPYADKIMVSMMREAAARDVAFRNKEIDTSILGPAQYRLSGRPRPQGHHRRGRRGLHPHMGMNPAFKPFSDKRVRQAINYAIDTDLIIASSSRARPTAPPAWPPLTSPLMTRP